MNSTQIRSGMNNAGLSCDKQTLLGSKYPDRNESLDNIDAMLLCQWALEGFASVEELKAALRHTNFVTPANEGFWNSHWMFRDAWGQGLVIEFIEGRALIYDDHNDKGETGFGIMTNQPPFPWQLQAVRHLRWKQSMARSAVAVPGAWYPDERFQRIHLVKSGLPVPSSTQEAVMQAVHVMNTISVPPGLHEGTDSGKGEGLNDFTHFGVVYDHKAATLYWRTETNQNLQRLRLQDAHLEEGKSSWFLRVSGPRLPWFSDAAAELELVAAAATVLVS